MHRMTRKRGEKEANSGKLTATKKSAKGPTVELMTKVATTRPSRRLTAPIYSSQQFDDQVIKAGRSYEAHRHRHENGADDITP
jgi:hypothetical protein